MSDRVQGWVWDLDLPPARKLVLLWLAERATDNGVAFPGEREIRARTGLCERMVRYHQRWLASDRDEDGRPTPPLVIRVERRTAGQRNTSNVSILAVPWQEPAAVRRDLAELQHVPRAATARPDRPEIGGGNRLQRGTITKEPSPNIPDPPAGAQQQGRERKAQGQRTPAAPAVSATGDAAVQALVAGFYCGLGMPVDAASSAIRRRELAIARQLIEAGATPTEAETYAQEARAIAGRIAPVDLRSYERERLTWLARRAASRSSERQLVDRTG